ncbi:ABC transporter permease [Phenylobacterium sp.]|uniref:ABC transporter permease n=1 Tax=Phenylobacterium sp. TaxID=1871053 RepID=UPI003563B8AE
MNSKAMVSGVLRSLWRRKVRSLLMMSGVLIGVASLTLLSSIGAGTKEVTLGRFKNMLGAFDTVIVQPGGAKNRGMVTVSNTDATLSFDDAAAIAREAPAIRQVVQVLNILDGDVSYQAHHETAGVFGVSVNWTQVRRDRAVEGDFFDQGDVDALARTAVLGADLKAKLFPTEDPIGKTIRIGGVPFVVKGVLAPRGVGPSGQTLDNLLYIPVTTASKRLFNRDYLTMVVAQLKDETQSKAAEAQIKALLRDRHHLAPGVLDNFTVSSPRAVIAQVSAMGSAMGKMLNMVALLAMLLGGVVILSVMFIGVAARRREIGLRRAAGASRNAILAQFLLEAAALSGLGAVIGAVLGIAGAQLVGLMQHLPFVVDVPAVAMALALSVLVGLIFGLLPAWRAAHVDPAMALRQ